MYVAMWRYSQNPGTWNTKEFPSWRQAANHISYLVEIGMARMEPLETKIYERIMRG